MCILSRISEGLTTHSDMKKLVVAFGAVFVAGVLAGILIRTFR